MPEGWRTADFPHPPAAAGRRPPGGSGELRSPSAVLGTAGPAAVPALCTSPWGRGQPISPPPRPGAFPCLRGRGSPPHTAAGRRPPGGFGELRSSSAVRSTAGPAAVPAPCTSPWGRGQRISLPPCPPHFTFRRGFLFLQSPPPAAAGRRPPGGSGELRSPSAVRSTAGPAAVPAPCTSLRGRGQPISPPPCPPALPLPGGGVFFRILVH